MIWFILYAYLNIRRNAVYHFWPYNHPAWYCHILFHLESNHVRFVPSVRLNQYRDWLLEDTATTVLDQVTADRPWCFFESDFQTSSTSLLDPTACLVFGSTSTCWNKWIIWIIRYGTYLLKSKNTACVSGSPFGAWRAACGLSVPPVRSKWLKYTVSFENETLVLPVVNWG